MNGAAGLDIVSGSNDGRTHGRENPSGAICALTIGRVAPGPIAAETLPATAARTKAGEQNCNIANKKGQNKKKEPRVTEMHDPPTREVLYTRATLAHGAMGGIEPEISQCLACSFDSESAGHVKRVNTVKLQASSFQSHVNRDFNVFI